jgi:hypothetical protein
MAQPARSPRYDPGIRGAPGVVARSEVDAVAGDAGQGGGPMLGRNALVRWAVLLEEVLP